MRAPEFARFFFSSSLILKLVLLLPTVVILKHMASMQLKINRYST